MSAPIVERLHMLREMLEDEQLFSPATRRIPAEAADTIEALLEALNWYAEQMCEHSTCFEGCGKLPPEQCAGCPARAAIAKAEGGQ